MSSCARRWGYSLKESDIVVVYGGENFAGLVGHFVQGHFENNFNKFVWFDV